MNNQSIGLLVAGLFIVAGFAFAALKKESSGGGSFKLPIVGAEFDAKDMPSLLIILGFVAVGYSLIFLSGGSESGDRVTDKPSGGNSAVVTGSAVSGATPPSLNYASMNAALVRGVSAVHASRATVQAAVWVDGADAPVVVGDDLRQRMRPWSMVRVATTIAAYRAAVASGQPGPSPALTDAMRGTLVGAENCAHHRVVLTLQELSGGPDGARAAVAKVYADAGVRDFEVASHNGDADPTCDPYPDGAAVLFGTSTWTIVDAIMFTHALAAGAYGDAGRFVVRLMREAKQVNRDPGVAVQYSAPLDWGAGKVLARWDPAYKGGWGGSQVESVRYLAGQIVIAQVAGRNVAIAIVIHPDLEPTTDDPGTAGVIEPIDAVFRQLAQRFAIAG